MVMFGVIVIVMVSVWLVWMCVSVLVRLVRCGISGVVWCFGLFGVVVCVWVRWWWMLVFICVVSFCNVLLGLCLFLVSLICSVVSGVLSLCVRLVMWWWVFFRFVLFWLISVLSLLIMLCSLIGCLDGIWCVCFCWIVISDVWSLCSGCRLNCSCRKMVVIRINFNIVSEFNNGVSVCCRGCLVILCGLIVVIVIGFFVVLSVSMWKWIGLLVWLILLVGCFFLLWCVCLCGSLIRGLGIVVLFSEVECIFWFGVCICQV